MWNDIDLQIRATGLDQSVDYSPHNSEGLDSKLGVEQLVTCRLGKKFTLAGLKR